MPETISLRGYLAKLETLVNVNATDEVIHHCRHILQYFPKNAAVYRLLGRALLASSRWKEAGDIFRRILSAYPDDFTAHLGLSDVYQQQNQAADAIWHLERAFEQNPNDRQLIESLRELYRKHQNVDQARIQLTTAAVARQYARNGLYAQSLETLRTTLERIPERIDLRLLMAETLWSSERRTEAAEVALDVLRVLPDCVEANRILTELWLQEDRPTDAQRYLRRIEEVDPYLAMALARGTEASDDTFTLEELDYRRFAQSEQTTNQPDWLSSLDETDFAASLNVEPNAPPSTKVDDWANWQEFDTSEGEPPITTWETASPEARGRAKTGSLPDWLDAVKPKTDSLAPRPEVTDLDIDFPFDDLEKEGAIDSIVREQKRDTSELASILAAKPHAVEDLPDWLSEAAPSAAQSSGEEDELSWMNERSNTVAAPDNLTNDVPGWLDEDAFNFDAPAPAVDPNDLFGWIDSEAEPTAQAAAPAAPADEDDPFAWMNAAGVELDNTPAPAPAEPDPANFTIPSNDASDPLAWLRDSGVEIEEKPVSNELIDPFDTDSPITFQDPASDPLSWMKDSGIDDLLVETPPDEAPAANEGDMLAWLEASDAWDQEMAAPPPSGITEDGFEWLQDDALLADTATSTNVGVSNPAQTEDMTILELDTSSALDDFSLFDEPGASSSLDSAPVMDRQDAMSDKDQNFSADWLDPQSDNDDSSSDAMNFEWMSDPSTPAASAGGSDLPDWLNDLSPETPAEQPAAPESISFDALDWEADAGEPSTEAISGNDMPDWLSEIQSDSSVTVVASDLTAPDTGGMDWLNTSTDAEPVLPAQPSAVEPGTGMWELDENAAEPAVDLPDWLNHLQNEPQGSESAIQNEEVTIDFDFQTDPAQIATGENPLAAQGTVPEWVSEIEPEYESTSANDELDISWMTNSDKQGVSEALASQVPDWLVSSSDSFENAPAPQAENFEGIAWESISEDDMLAQEPTAAADTPAWLSSLDEDDEELSAAEPAAEVPDWLTSLEPQTDSAPAASSTGFGEIDWGDTETEEAQPAAIADTPDWLTSMDESEAVAASEPAAVDTPDWLSAMEDEDLEAVEPAVAVDTPDWLSSMAPETESAQPTSSGFGEIDWGDDDSEAEQPAAVAETPDWLTSSDEAISAVEPAPVADTPDWLTSLDDDEAVSAAEPAAVADTPDWLTSLDDDEAVGAVEPAAAVADTPDWLSGLEPETEAEPVQPAASTSGYNQIDWNDSSEAEAAAVADTPDWLSAMEEDEENAEPAAPVMESPDWLSDLNLSETPAPGAAAAALIEDEADYDELAASAAIAGDMPDWLNGLTTPEAAEPEVPAAEGVDLTSLDWGFDETAETESEMGETLNFEMDASPAVTGDAPGWLLDFEEEEPLASETGTDSSLPDWLSADDNEIAALLEGEDNESTIVTSSGSGGLDWLTGEDEIAEGAIKFTTDEMVEAEHRPAENAPDWLNAMVPGVDVGYDADEGATFDAPLPPDTLPDEMPVPAQRNIQWLVDMVEEETGQMSAVDAASRVARFVFSKRPAWLRGKQDATAHDDWANRDNPADEADLDLPEWLK